MTCEDDGYKTPGTGSSCPPALRNRYFRGKMLTVADYEMEQRYLIQRRRLVNRAVLGWGVISGFRVDAGGGKISISNGVAFDPRGREVVACEAVKLTQISDVVWLTEEWKACGKAELDKKRPKTGLYVLSAHYAECKADGVRVEEGCNECSSEWNHVRETVVYSLRPESETCDDNRPNCNKTIIRPFPDPATADVGDRGTHATLVGWGRKRLDRPPALDPCRIDDFCGEKGLAFDARAGVPLACVWVDFDKCGDLGVTDLRDRDRDSVNVRRILYPNDDLYDLIRGCDLTRIKSVSWSEYEGRVMDRETFGGLFISPQQYENEKAKDYRRRNSGTRVPSKLKVEFTAPVQYSSLTRDCVAITLITDDTSDEFGNVTRLPLARPLPDGLVGPEPKPGEIDTRTITGFYFAVPFGYWFEEIESEGSTLNHPTVVEIEIFGDSFLDWQGQTLAAARRGPSVLFEQEDGSIGYRGFPTGGGMQGGTFRSVLRVTAGEPEAPNRPERPKELSDYPARGDEE